MTDGKEGAIMDLTTAEAALAAFEKKVGEAVEVERAAAAKTEAAKAEKKAKAERARKKRG